MAISTHLSSVDQAAIAATQPFGVNGPHDVYQTNKKYNVVRLKTPLLNRRQGQMCDSLILMSLSYSLLSFKIHYDLYY